MTQIKLIQGDCLQELKKLPDNCAQLALTSPPYNMNLRIRNGKYCSRQIVKEISTKYVNYADNLGVEEYFNLNRQVVDELLRVCGTVFYNVQFLTGNKQALYRLIRHFHTQLKEFIVWDKVNAEPAIGAGVLNSRWEALLVFQRPEESISRAFKQASFDRGTLSNLWQIKRGPKVANTHGAVFPLELAQKIVENFTQKGDTVIDPFLGTGTTAVACRNTQRSCMGVEISEDYLQIAKRRLSEPC